MTATRTSGIRIACAIATALPMTADAATLIHAGRLIDGRSDTVRTSVTIAIEGDRIARIVDGYTPPEGVVHKSRRDQEQR